ncbi:MAG: hypothetical protein ACKOKG_01780, partial [Verrucomicrobiota bacterium]
MKFVEVLILSTMVCVGLAAETPHTDAPTAATNTPPVEYGLNPNLGSLPTENLHFKAQNQYIERQ